MTNNGREALRQNGEALAVLLLMITKASVSVLQFQLQTY